MTIISLNNAKKLVLHEPSQIFRLRYIIVDIQKTCDFSFKKRCCNDFMQK